MESNTTTATIAELWDEFDGIIRLSIPHLDKLSSHEYSVDDARRPEYARQLKQCNERLAELRDQLLKRREPPLPVCVDENGVGHADPFRILEYHREMSAWHAFIAWELEQRQKGQAPT
jgi:hypothetical protein